MKQVPDRAVAAQAQEQPKPGGLRLALACLIAAATAGAAQAGEDRVAFRVLGTVIVWSGDSATGAPIVRDFIINTGTGTTGATSGDTDLIAGDALTVITGSLTPVDTPVGDGRSAPILIRRPLSGPNFSTDINKDGVMSAADAFSAFGLRSNTDTSDQRATLYSSFYVASNVPFSIDGQATPMAGTTNAELNRIQLTMRVTLSGSDDGISFGSAAQYPHSSGAAGGMSASGRRLTSMLTPVRVFRGNQRTARVPGSIVEQSVRFDMRYTTNLAGTYDLASGTIDAGAEVVYTVYIP